MDTHRGPSFPPQRWGVHETGSTPLGWSLDGLARAASVPPAVTMTSTFSATGARSLPATVVRWSVSVSPTCPEAWADSDVRTSRCRTCRSPTTIGSVSGTTPGSSPPAVPCRDYGRDYADCGLGVQRRGDQHYTAAAVCLQVGQKIFQNEQTSRTGLPLGSVCRPHWDGERDR